LLQKVFVCVGKNRAIAVVGEGYLKTGGKFGEEWGPQVVDHQPDQACVCGTQFGVGPIPDVAELAR
jgi:hypothetical protein